MAVDQDGGAEIAVQPREQAPQCPMIRLVEAVDAPQRFGHRDALIVDFLGVADDARHRAEPARDPHRTGIGERGQPAVEHARVEFIGLAVDVDIAAREMRPHQRIAARHHARDQIVDEGILRAAQRRQIEPRGQQEGARIDAPAVRRIENQRPAALRGLDGLERRIEFVLDVQHDAWRAFLGLRGPAPFPSVRQQPLSIGR